MLPITYSHDGLMQLGGELAQAWFHEEVGGDEASLSGNHYNFRKSLCTGAAMNN